MANDGIWTTRNELVSCLQGELEGEVTAESTITEVSEVRAGVEE